MKKPRLIMILIALVLIGLNYFEITKDQNYHQVLAVADGDTILVDLYGKTETVRFIGVDTPETQHPNKPVQCYGPEASQYLKDRLEGEYVRLEADTLSDNLDRYDRLLRFVYTEDNQLVNLNLVEQGYGFAVTGFMHSKMPEFVSAQQNAKNQKNGLWGKCKVDESGKYPSTTSQNNSSSP